MNASTEGHEGGEPLVHPTALAGNVASLAVDCVTVKADDLENVAFNFERAILFGDAGLAPATSEVACWKVALLDLKKSINAGKRPEDSPGLEVRLGGAKK